MITVKTPQIKPKPVVSVFLAGSIENGAATMWQSDVIQQLNDSYGNDPCVNVEVFNPRRDDWDISIDPSEPSGELQYQIEWELDHLERSDIVLMYFDENTKSPISLLELGLHKHKQIIVFCPKAFWRSANVVVTCQYYDVDVYDTVVAWRGAWRSAIAQKLYNRDWDLV